MLITLDNLSVDDGEFYMDNLTNILVNLDIITSDLNHALRDISDKKSDLLRGYKDLRELMND